jgi:2-C-methyl-D-erythritol 4-phosphate cytidylyltransferase
MPGAPIVVVEPPGDPRLRQAVERDLGVVVSQQITWVSGGAERSDSVRAGLAPVRESGCPWVLVHDCARALTPAGVFARVREGLEAGASGVIPAVSVVDTVKLVSADGTHIESTPPRSRLRAVQTPQGFRVEDLWRAHGFSSENDDAGAASASATDDAMLLEALGLEVRLVEGDPRALKVTTPIDLVLAEHYLAHTEETG